MPSALILGTVHACLMLTDDDLAVWIAGLDDLFALVAGRFFRVERARRAAAGAGP
jgi:hypothetical protein